MPSAALQSLRERLRGSSVLLSSHTRQDSRSSVVANIAPSRLASLSARWQLVLTPANTLHTLRAGAASSELELSCSLPHQSSALVPSRAASSAGLPRVAVVAARGVAVATVDAAAGKADVTVISANLFRARPGLRVLQVAWHPRAEEYLVILTSDGSLRIFDVAGEGEIDTERTRLRIVTAGDVPVSFAFGKGDGWGGLAVYILTESGALYVASPIAPVGTRLSADVWQSMVAEAESVLDQNGAGRGPASASASASVGTGAARKQSNVIIEETSAPVRSSGGLPSLSGNRERPAGSGKSRPPTQHLGMMGPITAASPRRQLHFGALDEDDDVAEIVSKPALNRAASSRSDRGDVVSSVSFASREPRSAAIPGHADDSEASWTVRQARLQLRFLERAFQEGQDGTMLVIREFKPAPVLFQGPLYVERDDVDEEASVKAQFVSLTFLDSGPLVPPILLRCSSDGNVSVLVGMEPIEGQWFLSNDRFGTTGDSVLEASSEYAKAASVVSPSLLCLEHLEFPAREPVTLHPVRGKTDFDVLFAWAGSAVYAVRLNFLSAIRAPETLRSSKETLITPLLSVGRLGESGSGPEKVSAGIVGIAPFFEKNCGPLAIALTTANALEATAPLRWISDDASEFFPGSLVQPPRSQDEDASPSIMDASHAVAGNSQDFGAKGGYFAGESIRNLRGSALEVAEQVAAVQEAQNVQSWALGENSVGKVAEASKVSEVLACLEARVAAYTGGDDGRRGVGDELKALGLVVPKWASEVASKVDQVDAGLALVQGEIETRVTESEALAVKLRRVQELNQNLRGRVDCLHEIYEAKQATLSIAEVQRLAKLKERRRRAAATRRKLGEVGEAVAALTAAVEDAAARKRLSVGSAMRTPGIDNAIGSLSISPLMGRRASTGGRAGYADANSRGTPGAQTGNLSAAQLQRIKQTLAEHSSSIQRATESTNALWQKFASV